MLLKMVPQGSRVALSVNALDNVTNEIRARIYQREKLALEDLGLAVFEFDLRNYFEDKTKIKSDLKDYSMFWATGGNAFVLNLAMHLSGFNNEIHSLLNSKSLVYGGYSAGACVAGSSLRGLDIVDKTDSFPSDYPTSKIIWEGLGLVDYIVVPHYKSEHPESKMIDSVVVELEKLNLPYKSIRDGEVILQAD